MLILRLIVSRKCVFVCVQKTAYHTGNSAACSFKLKFLIGNFLYGIAPYEIKVVQSIVEQNFGDKMGQITVLFRS